MSSINGSNFTNFQNIRVRGSGTSGTGGAPGVPGAIRFANAAAGGFESTFSVSTSQEANSDARLDARPTVRVGTTGTFFVQLGVIAASGYLETMVTVSGLRREDAFLCNIRDMGGTAVTVTTRTYPILMGARPENGYAYLSFVNPTTTATVFSDLVMAYTAFR